MSHGPGRGNDERPATPWLRPIIFDWHAGPVAGLVETARGSRVYSFQMVGWDPDRGVRVYVLRPQPAGIVARARQLAADAPMPRTEEERARSWAEMLAILRDGGEIEHVLITPDAFEGAISGRPVSAGESRTRLASMCLDRPGDRDGVTYSDHTLEEWIAAIEPVRPYGQEDFARP